MAFDEFWEKQHSTRAWGKYPNEMFVRFMLGSYKNVSERGKINVLEIGSGGGANLWFVAKEGFNAYGIDASQSAVKNAEKFLAAENVHGKFINDDAMEISKLFPDTEFDVIFDICTLSHLKLAESNLIVEQAKNRLRPGGRFFSTVFATGSWGDGMGKRIGENCYAGIPEGPFKGINVVQLMTLEDVQKWGGLFENYNIEKSSNTMNGRQQSLDYFILTAQK